VRNIHCQKVIEAVIQQKIDISSSCWALMEARQRSDKQTQIEKKRKRESSGAMSASELMHDVIEEQESEPMESEKLLDEDAVWRFLRENVGAVVQKIMTSEEWRECMTTQDYTMRELEEENKQLKSRLAIAEGALTRCEKTVKRLEEKVTDLTARSMRDNIILKNIEETTEEKNLDIEEKVRTVLKTELKIPEAEMSKIEVERAHRTGQQVTGRSRNIVAKLNSKGKSVVLGHLRNLEKTSKVKIVEQYPPEIHANRDKLWPVFVEAKSQGKKARWNVDKLTIDGKTINPPKDSIRDINLDVTGEAIKLKVNHTDLTSRNNHHFQAHYVEIDSVDQVIPAMKALCADATIAGSSHLMYAYRVGSDKHAISNWEDDGEWGAGKKIMEAIGKSKSYNILVCVTHWQGHSHLGPVRYNIISDLSNSAIQLSKFPH
jgi:predicted DNA-binding protein YlxM (UPF0122 family)